MPDVSETPAREPVVVSDTPTREQAIVSEPPMGEQVVVSEPPTSEQVVESDNSSDVEITWIPRTLQPTKKGSPRLGSVPAYVGIVAAQGYTAQGWESNIVVTTPNAKWVPEFAVAHSEITTFTDGRWGRHEYSRWPQQFARDAFHIHCIPASPRPDGPREILWQTLSPLDWKPADCGVTGLGFLEKKLENALIDEAVDTISRYEKCPTDHKAWTEIGTFLVICLRHAFDRLRSIPAISGVVISLAAHVQRLTLELSGLVEWLNVVIHRVKTEDDHSLAVLDVLGAWTGDVSVAQMLHRAGIPVWLQHQNNQGLRIYEVVYAHNLPVDFSTTPSYPRLVLAKRDLSGALNMPGEWERAMAAVVRRQLCESQLPELLEAKKDDTLPPAKRLREGVVWIGDDSSSLGAPKPAFVIQNPRSAKTLKHDLPPVPSASSSQSNTDPAAKKPSRRARARHAKKIGLCASPCDAPTESSQAKGFAMIPSRQYYPSQHLAISSAWATALTAVSPVPQPRTSVRYYFAPPWLLDDLRGFDAIPEKTTRYIHQWVAIRTFCRVRLFDSTVVGRPLTISEWRDALWGDYDIHEEAAIQPGPSDARPKLRHQLQVNIRRLFGQGGSLPSYRANAQPQFGKVSVTLDMVRSDSRLRRNIVWDAHETNWRCELLALDALMVGSNEWSELQRWMREALVSHIWGSGSSGIDVVPLTEEQYSADCWLEPPQEGWEACRGRLKAFVEVLGRWAGVPSELKGAADRVMQCTADEYSGILAAAVSFYVQTFVAKYERLPVPPSTTGLVLDAGKYGGVIQNEAVWRNNTDVTISDPSMGVMKWRAQEILLLETVAESAEGKRLMKMAVQKGDSQGKNYWFRNAAHYFVKKYKEELSACFEDETRVEFAFRQRCQPRAKLQLYMRETETERDERLNTVNSRIENWVKSRSENRSRRALEATVAAVTDVSQPPPTHAPVPLPPASHTHAVAPHPPTHNVVTAAIATPEPPTDTSTHVLGAAMTNSSAVPASTELAAVNMAVSVPSEPHIALPTDKQLHKLLELLKEMQVTLMRDRGWVGWCLLGGLNRLGKLGHIHPCTAYDRQGISFEQYLANQMGLTVDGLLCVFDNFVGSSFGRNVLTFRHWALPVTPPSVAATRRVDSGRRSATTPWASGKEPKGEREREKDKRDRKLDEGRAEVGTKARDLRKLVFTQTATD
ncbi:hypothetical protein BD311DRAFT_798761 [Dichomitus squalens]|uniref:Uncharacterized protein n=1 Tax=Dichomitus squalens TaxID=114155 RepID=A0A4Q9MG83_9APHY|nr:hypothetical protein BD311DRAFT_798761 [Dichomitus squalens]